MATTAAIILAQANQAIVEHFRKAEATSPDRAIAYAPASRNQTALFERLRRSGTIATTEAGDYYLDPVAYDAQKRRSRYSLAALALGLAAVTAATLALG